MKRKDVMKDVSKPTQISDPRRAGREILKPSPLPLARETLFVDRQRGKRAAGGFCMRVPRIDDISPHRGGSERNGEGLREFA